MNIAGPDSAGGSKARAEFVGCWLTGRCRHRSPCQCQLDCGGHGADLRGLSAARPHDDVVVVDPGDVYDGLTLALVKDDAPRITGFRVAAFQPPVLGLPAGAAQETDFGTLGDSPGQTCLGN